MEFIKSKYKLFSFNNKLMLTREVLIYQKLSNLWLDHFGISLVIWPPNLNL